MENHKSTLLTPREAAKVLGISRSSLDRLIASGEVPVVRFRDRIVRVSEEDLFALVRNRASAVVSVSRKAADTSKKEIDRE